MRYISLVILALWTTSLSAQESSSGNAKVAPPDAAAVTVAGCVVELNGGYTLAIGGNKQYLLDGDDAVLHGYLGQEVRVTGKTSYRKKPGKDGKAENMVILQGSPQTLTISKILKVADTCRARH